LIRAVAQELRLGTRGSQLALWQANTVAARIAASGGPPCRIVVIKTSGDRLQDAPLSEIGGKRLFVKEIEDALLKGDIDLAVHSSKDMPAVLPDGLTIAGVLPREDPLDAVVLPVRAKGSGLNRAKGLELSADENRGGEALSL
jgi:hydroxymethylbilane synthase